MILTSKKNWIQKPHLVQVQQRKAQVQNEGSYLGIWDE